MKWIKASERLPGVPIDKQDRPLKVIDSRVYDIGWYNREKKKWFTDSYNEYNNEDIEWLDESEQPIPVDIAHYKDLLDRMADGLRAILGRHEKPETVTICTPGEIAAKLLTEYETLKQQHNGK